MAKFAVHPVHTCVCIYIYFFQLCHFIFENPHSNEYDVHLETKNEHFYDVPEWMEIVDYSNLEPYIDEPDCLPDFTFSYEGDVVTLREFMKKYVFGGLISEADQEDPSYWED